MVFSKKPRRHYGPLNILKMLALPHSTQKHTHTHIYTSSQTTATHTYTNAYIVKYTQINMQAGKLKVESSVSNEAMAENVAAVVVVWVRLDCMVSGQLGLQHCTCFSGDFCWFVCLCMYVYESVCI